MNAHAERGNYHSTHQTKIDELLAYSYSTCCVIFCSGPNGEFTRLSDGTIRYIKRGGCRPDHSTNVENLRHIIQQNA